MVQRAETELTLSELHKSSSTLGINGLIISDDDDSVVNAFCKAMSFRQTDCDSTEEILNYCSGSLALGQQMQTKRSGVLALKQDNASGLQITNVFPPTKLTYCKKTNERLERGEFSFALTGKSSSRSKLQSDSQDEAPILGPAAKNCFLLGAFNKAYTVESMSNALLKNNQARGEMFTPTYTVVFLGELSVGKSALCRKFFRSGKTSPRSSRDEPTSQFSYDEDEDFHSPDYATDSDGNIATAESHHVYERPVTVDGRCVRLRILDINAEKHRTECGDCGDFEPYLEAGDAYALTYSVADRGTFKTVMEILCRMSNNHTERMSSLPIILVGNKCDLVRKRQVTIANGVKLAAKYGIKVIETSASLNQNVQELFEGLIQQIRLRQDPINNTSGTSTLEPRSPEGGENQSQSPITDPESLETTSATSTHTPGLTKKKKYKRITRRLTEFLGGGEKDGRTQRAKSCQDLSIL